LRLGFFHGLLRISHLAGGSYRDRRARRQGTRDEPPVGVDRGAKFGVGLFEPGAFVGGEVFNPDRSSATHGDTLALGDIERDRDYPEADRGSLPHERSRADRQEEPTEGGQKGQLAISDDGRATPDQRSLKLRVRDRRRAHS